MSENKLKDIIQWDVRSWSKALRYWEAHVDWKKVSTGLELGGREGGLSLWMALKGVEVICSDLENVKQSAQKLHLQYNVSDRIRYQDIDATQIPYENHFDVIVFKSILGGIGRDDNFAIQKKVIEEIYKALKPGGKLLFAENLIASPIHRRLRKRFTNWGESWRYLSIEEMNVLLSRFSSYEMKMTGISATFGRTEAQRNFLSRIDEIVLNRISPDKWKYICYGVAVK
jgi:SAM-dependent methyltransferase